MVFNVTKDDIRARMSTIDEEVNDLCGPDDDWEFTWCRMSWTKSRTNAVSSGTS